MTEGQVARVAEALADGAGRAGRRDSRRAE